ncbi:MAG: tyrosine--tRNA ligase, partial [bacterium]
MKTLSPDAQLQQLKRGTVEIISEADLLAKLGTGRPLRVKLGVDPSAPDIHLGIAVVLRKLRQFQDLGHEAILVVGDFTGLIGDPSERKRTRPMLSREDIQKNVATYQDQYSRILDPKKTRVVFNSQWLAPMRFEDVIRLGAKTTVARVLEREDFATRLRSGVPVFMHELLYPLCQAMDSVQLQADVELGGTDQKFNNLMGRDLQREFGQEPQVVMLTPLLVGLDGVEKMSKSLG